MDSRATKNRGQQPQHFSHKTELEKRKQFSTTEVGLTHPDSPSFIRLNDNGDIEIFAAPGVGIIISAKSRSISMFAESISFHTKEDGLKWNNFNFNYSASSYIEPTLVKINSKTINSAHNNVSYYLDAIEQIKEEEKPTTITIVGEYGFNFPIKIPKQDVDEQNSLTGLNQEEIELVQAYATSNSQAKVDYMISLLKEGYSFIQAENKIKRDLNE